MILLAILQVLYDAINGVSEFLAPVVPEAVQTVVTYIMDMIDKGADILGYIFFDYKVLAPLFSWMLVVYLAIFAYDIVWHVIRFITLRGGNTD